VLVTNLKDAGLIISEERRARGWPTARSPNAGVSHASRSSPRNPPPGIRASPHCWKPSPLSACASTPAQTPPWPAASPLSISTPPDVAEHEGSVLGHGIDTLLAVQGVATRVGAGPSSGSAVGLPDTGTPAQSPGRVATWWVLGTSDLSSSPELDATASVVVNRGAASSPTPTHPPRSRPRRPASRDRGGHLGHPPEGPRLPPQPRQAGGKAPVGRHCPCACGQVERVCVGGALPARC